MDKTKTIIIITATASFIMIACGITTYLFGISVGKQEAYEEFQSDKCHIEKISNDVVCIKYVGGE